MTACTQPAPAAYTNSSTYGWWAIVNLTLSTNPYDELWINDASISDEANRLYATGGLDRGQIDAFFVTPWFDAGVPAAKKRWKRPLYIVEGDDASTLKVDVYHDWDADTVARTHTITVEATGGTDGSDMAKGSSLGSKNAVRLKIKSPTAEGTYTNEPHWGVDAIILKYVAKAVR